MNRIPEPELMNSREQAEAYAHADFSEPHDAFVRYFQSRFPGFSTGEVIDLGCGAADVIIRFSKAYPDVHITGIDGSHAMLQIGMKEVQKHGLESRISLKRYMLQDSEIQRHVYDAVLSNSLLHHLDNPFLLWDTVMHCSKKDAPIFIMDLMRPSNVETARLYVEKYASGADEILKNDFYHSLLAAYTLDEIRKQLDAMDIHHLSSEAVSDRHVIVWGYVNHEEQE